MPIKLEYSISSCRFQQYVLFLKAVKSGVEKVLSGRKALNAILHLLVIHVIHGDLNLCKKSTHSEQVLALLVYGR